MEPNTDGIAVIGLAGRFPGARNIDEFWTNLVNGKESITYFNDEELAQNIDFDVKKIDSSYIRARGKIDNIDKFDAEFFGYTPMEARTMDPQHRIWLETAWNALENAGCDPNRYKGSIGVFVGSLYNTYLLNNVIREQEALEKYLRIYDLDSFQIMINNDGSFLPTKTAYKLNLKGPAINVQTACSTSLVAISQACQSLFCFESDTCIAGGVSLFLPQESGYTYQKGAITSPDGHCRPFDADSNGTVASNGVGAVVLKRLDDALSDNDHIYAVIKGWAINNDGNKKVSFMAPSVDGQAEVIRMAQNIADVNPDDISYIETHGTGTPLGDPIEIAALTKAFREKSERRQFCAIGSVKSNIGHLDTSSGVAGFIKTCLAAYHRQIPPTINFKKHNPNIDFTKTPFYVLNELMIWTNKKPLIMGVSSFGIGGTNTHVIVQEPNRPKSSEIKSARPQLILLSAKSENALNNRKEELSKFCSENPNINLSDLAYTLQTGRSIMPFRSFGVFDKPENLKDDAFTERFSDSYYKDERKSIAFMFPGQGAQYVNMGRNLFQTEKLCRDIFNQCFDIFETQTGKNLQDILFADNSTDLAEQNLARTEFTQPALFIVEYVVAKYLESFGIRPKVLIGHSIGEYAAACLSGVFELEDALKIVIKRGQLMQKMPNGHMMVVKCDEEKLRFIKGNTFEIAAVNAPGYCTISFKPEYKTIVNNCLIANTIDSIHLTTSHAFHSSAFDPILEEFANYVEKYIIGQPKIPFISCLTGQYINQDLVQTGKYWADQLRNTVLFDLGINTITNSGEFILLEVGPNTHLSALARRSTENRKKCPIFSTLKKSDDNDDQTKIMVSIGQLWSNGIMPDFDKLLSPVTPKKVVLPSYPFEQKRHWIEKTAFKGSDHTLNHADKNLSYCKLPDNQETDLHQHKNVSDTIEILKQMLCDLSGIEPISVKPTVSFAFLGLESLFLAQLAQAIEKRFKISIKFRQLMQEYPNLELLSRYIDDNKIIEFNKDKKTVSLKPGGNLVIFKPEGQKLPFTMIYGDICNTYLPIRINSDNPYWGFMHYGSDGEKIEFRSIKEMAKSYVDELVAYKPNGPYLLGGYSFGGIVAFEMAVQLKKSGFDVPLLIMIDCLNPLKKKLRITLKGAMYILKTTYKEIVYRILSKKNKSLAIDFRKAYIMDTYKKLWIRYIPSKFEGHITFVKSSDNPSKLKYLGWDEHSDSIDLIELEGDHMQIIRKEKNVEQMVNCINGKLREVQSTY